MKKLWIGMMVFAALGFAHTAQAALLAEFTFDTDATDTAGGHDGLISAGTVSNGVLTLDAGGYMDLAATFGAVNPMGGSSNFTIVMDYKTTAGCTLLGLSAGVADTTIPDLAVWIRGNREWLYHDNYYAGDPRITVTGIKDGTWKTLVITYDADASPVITFTTDGVTGTSTVVPSRDVSGDTLRIGGTIHPNMGSAAPAGLAFDNIRIYNSVSVPAGLIVKPTAMAITHPIIDSSTTSTLDVSYNSPTNMNINISISGETHPGAFSVLSATNQTLTSPSPAIATLQFKFDNIVAGLAAGGISTGLVTIAWSEVGGGTSGQVLVPISATAAGPALIVVPSDMKILHDLSGATSSTSSVDVSYLYATNMQITISISNQTIPGAFSVLSATNQTLTTPSPATSALDFKFDNTVAGLAHGGTATGLVTIAWSTGWTNGLALVPISATALAPPEGTLYSEDFSVDPGYVANNNTSIGAAGGSGAYFTFGQYNGTPDIGVTTGTGVLHINSLLGGTSARSRGLSVFIDTSAARAGTYTVSFDVSNWTNGTGTAGFKVLEGSGLDAGYIQLGNSENTVSGNVPKKTGGTATWTSLGSTWGAGAAGTGISSNGTVSFEVTLTKAGQAGDYLALAWVQVRSTATELAPTFDVDNVWVGVGVPPASSYSAWALSYTLTGDDALEGSDVEPDGLDNLMEYALGGNPTIDDAAAVSPRTFRATAGGTNWFYHVHNQNQDPNLTFTVGATPDLVFTPADDNDVELVGATAEINGFKTVTNRTEAATAAKFIKLEVSK